MAFANNYRLERVYFEKLKSMIDILKSFLDSETDTKARSLIENGIDTDGAILLLYRNLGECWAEMSDLIKKADEKIDALDEKTEDYHDELNERIDEVNNYLMALIRELTARVEAIEADLATMSRVLFLDLERANDEYTLKYKGTPVDFAWIADKVSFPHNVIVHGSVNGEETYFTLRESDTNTESGLFEFYAIGLVGNVIHELTVTVLPDNSVNVATEIQREYTEGTGIRISDYVISCTIPDFTTEINDLQTRMTNAETDIDTLEATAENLQENKQDKLTAGSGISIDPDTNEITNTAQKNLLPSFDYHTINYTVLGFGHATANYIYDIKEIKNIDTNSRPVLISIRCVPSTAFINWVNKLESKETRFRVTLTIYKNDKVRKIRTESFCVITKVDSTNNTLIKNITFSDGGTYLQFDEYFENEGVISGSISIAGYSPAWYNLGAAGIVSPFEYALVYS